VCHTPTPTHALNREQATSQLKATRAGADETQQMLAILTRLHEQQQLCGGGGGDEAGDGSGSGSGSSSGGSSGSASSDEDQQGGVTAVRRSPGLKRLLRRVSPRTHTGAGAVALTLLRATWCHQQRRTRSCRHHSRHTLH
jgi:hypothetical protein